ncbi:MAG: TMEM43 family protein [Pseudomonadota bacterium]
MLILRILVAIPGLLMLLGGVMALFIATFSLLNNITTLAAMEDAIIEIPSDRVDEKHNGELVALSGTAYAEPAIVDEELHLELPALVAERSVEMYQWSRHSEREFDDRVRYYYKKRWSRSLIDSARHNAAHKNPKSIPIESRFRSAESASIGQFEIAPNLIGRLETVSVVPDSIVQQAQLPKRLAGMPLHYQGNGLFFLGNNPDTPQIGDLRIRYRYTPSGHTVSAMGKHSGALLEAYRAGGLFKESLFVISPGKKGAQALTAEYRENKIRDIGAANGIAAIFILIGLALTFPFASEWRKRSGHDLRIKRYLGLGTLFISGGFFTLASLMAGAYLFAAGGLIPLAIGFAWLHKPQTGGEGRSQPSSRL